MDYAEKNFFVQMYKIAKRVLDNPPPLPYNKSVT